VCLAARLAAQQTRISHTTTSTTAKPHRRRTAFTIRFRSCNTRFTGLYACRSRVRALRTGSVLSITFGSIIANVQYCLLLHTQATLYRSIPTTSHQLLPLHPHHLRATVYRSIPASFALPTTQSVARRVLRRGGVFWARFLCDNIVRFHRIDTRAGFPDSCFHGPPFTTPRPVSHVCFTVRAMIVGNWGKAEGPRTVASVIMCCKWWSRSWRGKCSMAH
jgi:hypothetical protein